MPGHSDSSARSCAKFLSIPGARSGSAGSEARLFLTTKIWSVRPKPGQAWPAICCCFVGPIRSSKTNGKIKNAKILLASDKRTGVGKGLPALADFMSWQSRAPPASSDCRKYRHFRFRGFPADLPAW
jgi:hypothetical protein